MTRPSGSAGEPPPPSEERYAPPEHHTTHPRKPQELLKNQVHAILARNLVATCPHADLFSGVGRRWGGRQDLPADEWRSVEALLRQLDFHNDELAQVDRDIAPRRSTTRSSHG